MKINDEIIQGIFKYSPEVTYTNGDIVMTTDGGLYKVLGDTKGVYPSSDYPYISFSMSFGPDSDSIFSSAFSGLTHNGIIIPQDITPGTTLSPDSSGMYKDGDKISICIMGMNTTDSPSYLIVMNKDVVEIYKNMSGSWELLNAAGNIDKHLKDKITAINALETLLEQKLTQIEILNANLSN